MTVPGAVYPNITSTVCGSATRSPIAGHSYSRLQPNLPISLWQLGTYKSRSVAKNLRFTRSGRRCAMNTLWQNLRYGLRLLAKSPGFTAVTVLTLALGIGANTAIFSVVYSALLRPLPYYQADKLFKLAESRQQKPDSDPSQAAASYPDFLDWKRASKSFQALGAMSGDGFTLSGNGDPKIINAAQVTPNFFSTLGVRPLLGRDFIDADQQYGSPRVAMLTYWIWRTEFGGDPQIVGRTIRLDSKPAVAIGILPKNFEFAPSQSAQIWVPLHPSEDTAGRRNLRWLNVVGRLAAG